MKPQTRLTRGGSLRINYRREATKYNLRNQQSTNKRNCLPRRLQIY